MFYIFILGIGGWELRILNNGLVEVEERLFDFFVIFFYGFGLIF